MNNFWEWFNNNYKDDLSFLCGGYVEYKDIPGQNLIGYMLEYLVEQHTSLKIIFNDLKNSNIDYLYDELKSKIDNT